jgi:hypothetical protein
LNESRCSMTCETFSLYGVGLIPVFVRLFWNLISILNSTSDCRRFQQTKVTDLQQPALKPSPAH